MDVTQRKNIKKGQYVAVQTQESEAVSYGKVKKIYSTQDHPGGIKVGLNTGVVGRIAYIPTPAELEKDHFIYYHRFFKEATRYSLRQEAKAEWVFLTRKTPTGVERWLCLSLRPSDYPLTLPESVVWRPIRTSQPLALFFQADALDGVIIDGTRQLKWDSFVDLERKFLSMP